MNENKDYQLIETEGDEHFQIKLLSGKFSDTIYKYGKVSFHEEKNQLRISFNYEIVESPLDMVSKDLKVNSEFKKHISDILNDILLSENGFTKSKG
jgi:hypothetical protein